MMSLHNVDPHTILFRKFENILWKGEFRCPSERTTSSRFASHPASLPTISIIHRHQIFRLDHHSLAIVASTQGPSSQANLARPKEDERNLTDVVVIVQLQGLLVAVQDCFCRSFCAYVVVCSVRRCVSKAHAFSGVPAIFQRSRVNKTRKSHRRWKICSCTCNRPRHLCPASCLLLIQVASSLSSRWIQSRNIRSLKKVSAVLRRTCSRTPQHVPSPK